MAVFPLAPTVIFPVAAPVGTVTVRDVAEEAVTLATVPLNLTVLLPGVELKLVPVMVTLVPALPDKGVNEVMVGPGRVTVKSLAEAAVLPRRLTVIFPVVASAGTVTVSDVEVAFVTVAAVPLNLTTWSEGVVLKLVPVMVTLAPTGPDTGLKEVIAGICSTVKSTEEEAVLPFSETEIFPLVALAGTVTMISFLEEELTAAVVPLNWTVSEEGVSLKLVPLMVMLSPAKPEAGVKEVMDGTGFCSSLLQKLIAVLSAKKIRER